jgi:hypothetical protein
MVENQWIFIFNIVYLIFEKVLISKCFNASLLNLIHPKIIENNKNLLTLKYILVFLKFDSKAAYIISSINMFLKSISKLFKRII